MKRLFQRILIVPMLAAVCSCASSSSTPNQSNPDVSQTVINGKVAPDANGNNRDQPIQTDAPTIP